MEIREIISNYIGGNARYVLEKIVWDNKNYNEIRLRVNRPIILYSGIKTFFLTKDGQLLNKYSAENKDIYYIALSEDIKKSVELISNYSLYAFENETRNGYITLPGGHRIGISGEAVVEAGLIKNIKYINGLNYRITKEIIGCGNEAYRLIKRNEILNTLIISPPCCGKTTLLRDLSRLLGREYSVSIIDERAEIAGCYLGVPQNDIGLMSDVLTNCPKSKAMSILLRSMSPQIIIADEIGSPEDILAIDEVVNSGVKLICSAHGSSIDEIKNKSALNDIIDKKIFDLYIVLENKNKIGAIKKIFDKNLKEIKGD